jgi:IMP dehydrogenase
MVRKVKKYKAGFVISDTNLPLNATLRQAESLIKKTGHTTVAVTHDGSAHGRLLGILTSRDYQPGFVSMDEPIAKYMMGINNLIVAKECQTLSEANAIIWKHKLDCLPIIGKDDSLKYLVFRKDCNAQKQYPAQLADKDKRLMVGAGINTRDYLERVPALIEAGADVLCIDSADGFTEWQADTLRNLRSRFGPHLIIGGGNVVDTGGFRYLAEAGADFIKVGIGGGSICITREQKGIGRGQASALIDVCNERDRYFKEKGTYIPICSDGGILFDYHMTLALAMGADFLMPGPLFRAF